MTQVIIRLAIHLCMLALIFFKLFGFMLTTNTQIRVIKWADSANLLFAIIDLSSAEYLSVR